MYFFKLNQQYFLQYLPSKDTRINVFTFILKFPILAKKYELLISSRKVDSVQQFFVDNLKPLTHKLNVKQWAL